MTGEFDDTIIFNNFSIVAGEVIGTVSGITLSGKGRTSTTHSVSQFPYTKSSLSFNAGDNNGDHVYICYPMGRIPDIDCVYNEDLNKFGYNTGKHKLILRWVQYKGWDLIYKS